MESKIDNERSNIVEFFRDSSVFLTGGTGFMGKLIVYKLFLTCQVSCVYLLVRKKVSKSSSERLQELLKNSIFVELESKVPDLANRIKLVEGDCSLENLGLSSSDEEVLCKSVNFVIHCAAAMDMMGSCKKSIEINVRGTLDVVNLAKKMANLKAFVHVSTLGAYMERDEIDEKLYESHLEYENLMNLLKLDKVLPIEEQNKKRIIGNKFTIYSMTKAAAENIFIKEELSVPVIIFRFLFAFPCLKEPYAGWADRFYGPSGAFVLPILDLIPVSLKTNFVIDCAPGDFLVNAIIALTQYSYIEYQKKIKDGSAKISPFVCNFSNRYRKNELPFEKTVSFMQREFNFTHHFYSNKFFFIVWSIMFSYIPMFCIDFFLLVTGSKLRTFRTVGAFIKLNIDLASANLASPVKTNNVQNCWKNLNGVDRKLFPFDLNKIVWDEYLPLLANSIREYLHVLLASNQMLRFAKFWVPKIRLAFKILYCALGFYFVYFIYSLFIQL